MTHDELVKAIARAKTDNAIQLVLKSAGIDMLPPEIGQLKHLRRLSLFNNRLAGLPAEIGELHELRELILTGNQLGSVPPEIRSLVRLKVLAIGTNPVFLIGHRSIVFDDLVRYRCRNQIGTLPPQICELRELEFLDVSDSHLEHLPERMGELVKLEGLDLSGNQLSELPDGLARLKSLKQLDLRRNPLPIPPEILERVTDPDLILSYYFAVKKAGGRRLNEAKMLLVGQGGVGKTSLVRYLIDKKKCDPGELPTEGINIYEWDVTGRRRGDGKYERICVHIWDFGGQEIMHATHQFFLTQRSLYLLVIDARSGEKESNIHYWLEIIRSFGGDSPVLVVVNKSDLHPHELNETRLMKDFPNIRGFLLTSCEAGRGIRELRREIGKQIRLLPHVFDSLPVNYFQIKEEMVQKANENNYVPIEEYQEVCRANGLKDQEGQTRLIRFLHDLGILLNFQDPHDPYSLNDPFVLNPEWVTEGVYSILNDKELKAKRDGLLTRSRLKAILNARDGYPERRHDFIVRKMCQFELAFECQRGRRREQTWLIPELLDPKEPKALNWEEAGALNFQYDYSVLPAGVICRFIVRMRHAVQRGSCWRSGAVVEINGSKVLVRGDVEKSKVFIAVQGPVKQRRERLEVVRDAFRYIHSTIPALEASEAVPLPDDPEIAVPYTHLLAIEELGQSSFVPQGSRRVYQVQDLLNGVDSVSYRRRRRRVKLRERGFRVSDEKHVFISYCHANRTEVARLVDGLEDAGVAIWWDQYILGGQDWKEAIRMAMRSAYAVVICLSPELTEQRYRSGVYPEIGDAISVYRQYGPGRAYIFPVKLAGCQVPPIEIDDTRTLDRIQHIDLFPESERASGIQKLLESLAAAPGHP